MKKVMLMMFLMVAGWLHAQEKTTLNDIDVLTFFGVDYSLAKTYGADETGTQLKEAFIGINNLFLSEPKKYDTNKAFHAEVVTNIAPSLKAIEDMDVSALTSESNDYTISDEEIARHIKKMNTGDAKDFGAVIIAGLLNKGKAEATLTVVVFNIDTKEIIASNQFTEKARGFGLRNFWAYPVYKTLGQIKKKM